MKLFFKKIRFWTPRLMVGIYDDLPSISYGAIIAATILYPTWWLIAFVIVIAPCLGYHNYRTGRMRIRFL